MKKIRTLITTAVMAALIGITGCTPAPGQAAAPSATATSEPSPTVLRAAAEMRSEAADRMRAATDQFRTAAWDAAKRAANAPSEERAVDPSFATVSGLTDTAVLDRVSEAVTPILAGKSLDDFEAWQRWLADMLHASSALQQWAAGDEAFEKQAADSLSAADEAIREIRE